MEHKGNRIFHHRPLRRGQDHRRQPLLPAAQNTKPNAVYLDGDEIRVAFGEDVGYTNDERLPMGGADLPGVAPPTKGIDVVCCSIAMYQSVRPGTGPISPITRRSI